MIGPVCGHNFYFFQVCTGLTLYENKSINSKEFLLGNK